MSATPSPWHSKENERCQQPRPRGTAWEKYSDKNRVEMRIAEKCEMESLYKADDVDFINQVIHGNEK
ncbi:hypothetical protein SPSIL_006890 [Sporomusa silvacetica DSM 10669]|uniref:Uncharacterized protein n=1 Tax=Sporomusa silvacetica DSM 10669 TaxID=1123289 RepID=A0ABZ3IGH6_9FIRM|nr:hypothetical protein [Sporomusa silvacetica]OZC16441.1 hypothetical protein SPSIL_37240 [Sporomusa silvacetica DSM 10669]